MAQRRRGRTLNLLWRVRVEEYTYLIIGGGMTADAAARGIREIDSSSRIGIISEENYPPYDRPPLSKGLWIGKQEGEIWRNTDQENVSFHLGTKIASIDPEAHQATDEAGNIYKYNKLLLATGGIPRRLEGPDEGVIYYRTLDHYYKLRALYDSGESFVVIGGGYIGTEIAASLAMNGKKVTLIIKESSISAKKLPKGFSDFLSSYFTEKGVKLICNQTVTSVTKEGSQSRVQTSNGETFLVDGVVAGLGITPCAELAEAAGLEVNNGIIVSRTLQTSHLHIFAAGDVANFYNPHLEKRLRIEHEDTANTMGKMAGRNMAGAGEEYLYLPYFYSDLFELGYEAVGELDSTMEIVEDWHELYRKGVLYYLQDGYVRGAILWGIWEQVDRIREMIAAKETVSANQLVGLIQ